MSLVGHTEKMPVPSDLKTYGISALRMPVRLQLKEEAALTVEAAHAAGCFILAVLQFSPQDSAWPEALRQTVERLSFVTHWEIDSEPDDALFGWPQDHLSTYAACLIQAAALIKNIQPQAKIHNGGLGRSLPKGLTQLCALGAGECIDIWNVHPYMNPLMPDAKGCLRYFQDMITQALAKEGQKDKPLWWSSIACPGMADPKAAANWWLGKNPTETMQAEWLKILLAMAANTGVERLFWEGWQDHPHPTSTGIDYFGFLRADGSPKPLLSGFRVGSLGPI